MLIVRHLYTFSQEQNNYNQNNDVNSDVWKLCDSKWLLKWNQANTSIDYTLAFMKI